MATATPRNSNNKMNSAVGGKKSSVVDDDQFRLSHSIGNCEFFHGMHYEDVFIDLANLSPKEIPSSLAHSAGFWSMFIFWTALTIAVPTGLFITLLVVEDYTFSDTTATILWVVTSTLFFGGLLYFLWHIRLVLKVLVNGPPPAACQVPFEQRPRIQKFKHALLVYNPHAGKEKAEKTVKETVVPALESGGMKVTLCPTESPGHARKLVAEDYDGVDMIIAVGGDGTLHEVLNGLVIKNGHKIAGHMPVAIIPMGSGNALYTTCRQNFKKLGKEVSIYDDMNLHMMWSCNSITAGHVSNMDIAEVHFNGKKLAAISNVFCGFVADIDMIAEPWRWMGNLRFDIAAIWQICRMPPCFGSLMLTHLDGRKEELPMGSFMGFSVSIVQHWSESMRTSPSVCLDDGTLTISILRSGLSRGQLLAGFLIVDKGAHVELGKHNAFDIIKVKDIDFRTRDPGYFNIDGEIYKHDGRIQFTQAKDKLQLVGCRDLDDQTPRKPVRLFCAQNFEFM